MLKTLVIKTQVINKLLLIRISLSVFLVNKAVMSVKQTISVSVTSALDPSTRIRANVSKSVRLVSTPIGPNSMAALADPGD